MNIPKQFIDYVVRSQESKELANKYLEYNALSQKSYEDAHHIALATIANANILVSWNFKHIVNINRINIYNNVNSILNYKQLDIRSPREVLHYGK